jgi:aryl-phospho-beta-D-glucosidase BglC (GH1 family)
MTEIAVYLLDYAAKNGPITDATWNSLLSKTSYSAISSQVVDIRNNILNGVAGYAMTVAKFQFLHEWLEQSDINIDSHCIDAANQILAKVVDDDACKNIILAKKDYYRPIIATTYETASALHDKLKKILEQHGDTEFAGFIREGVDYENVIEDKGKI